MLKTLLTRHFASAGFQKRLKYIYLPMFKKGLAYFWNMYADRKERAIFDKVYRSADTVLRTDVVATAASSPKGATIPLYENIAERLKIWFTESPYQGSTGQCVAFTLDNIVRAIAKLIGFGEIAVSPLDVYLDRTTRVFKGDYTGMNVALMFSSVARKGVAVGELLPRMSDQSLMVNVDDRVLYPDTLVDPFRLKILKEAQNIGSDWKNLMNTINSLPMGYPVQISLGVGDGYFGYDIPKERSAVEYGGHSVTAIGGSGCIVDGKEGFFITDSAYYKNRVSRWGVTIRFITKSYWLRNGWNAMLPVFVDAIQKEAIKFKPEVEIEAVVKPSQQAEEGVHVREIQNALISLGYDIPSGATGFYGSQTSLAVLEFQIKNIKYFQELDKTYTVEKMKSLGGKYFGNLSVKVINMLISSK